MPLVRCFLLNSCSKTKIEISGKYLEQLLFFRRNKTVTFNNQIVCNKIHVAHHQTLR